MNQDIKRQWLDALTSGEYQQTQFNLHTDEGYCCLGVLVDLYLKAHGMEWQRDVDESSTECCVYGISYSTYPILLTETLPTCVANWAGIILNGNDDLQRVMNWNDSGDYSFKEIADLIEGIPLFEEDKPEQED
jgi:hypothetical protein